MKYIWYSPQKSKYPLYNCKMLQRTPRVESDQYRALPSNAVVCRGGGGHCRTAPAPMLIGDAFRFEAIANSEDNWLNTDVGRDNNVRLVK